MEQIKRDKRQFYANHIHLFIFSIRLECFFPAKYNKENEEKINV